MDWSIGSMVCVSLFLLVLSMLALRDFAVGRDLGLLDVRMKLIERGGGVWES